MLPPSKRKKLAETETVEEDDKKVENESVNGDDHEIKEEVIEIKSSSNSRYPCFSLSLNI